MIHKIISVELIEPDGIDWKCECGGFGRCPRRIAAEVLEEHLAGR